ncbi:MAG: hypothetical protein ACE5E6_07435 [Phycisphaerae bacterium]
MKRRMGIRVVGGFLAFLGAVAGVGCDGGTPGALVGVGTGDDVEATVAAPTDAGPQSVADVTVEITTAVPAAMETIPASAIITARVRNESDARVDVTLRFISADVIVHLAFLEVMPGTVTTVVSPRPADTLLISGIDEHGVALASGTFVYGTDFDEDTAATYGIVQVEDGPAASVPGDAADPGPVPPPGETIGAPMPDTTGGLTISLIEPSDDRTAPIGSKFDVKWTDESDTDNAVVRIGLRPVGSGHEGTFLPIAPPVGEPLDGLNDRLEVVVQGIDDGLYEVVGRIDDGETEQESVAPGLIEVVTGADNAAPTLAITGPSAPVELFDGEAMVVTWADDDADDNATITFALVASEPLGGAPSSYVISPPLAEDPDGPSVDEALLLIQGVLPGVYDLVGTIADGTLVGTSRVERIVRMLADPDNDLPTLELIEPAVDIELEAGHAFGVQWVDSDDNDNGLISVSLSPEAIGVPQGGNEILIAASIAEDPDGVGDVITLGVPHGVASGTYRVMGAITDGVSQVITYAPGRLIVSDPPPMPDGPPPPSIELTKPVDDVFMSLGDPITATLHAVGLPDDTKLALFLDNTVFGGDVRIEITPSWLDVSYATFIVPTGAVDIPNDAWPRRFQLEIEAVVDGATYTGVAPGTMWIRQRFAFAAAEMVHLDCGSPVPGGPTQAALQFAWYGGGFGAFGEELGAITFWLSGDGTIPVSGQGDALHRALLSVAESPGQVQTQTVGLDALTALVAGTYELIAVVAVPGDAVEETHADVPGGIVLCFPDAEPPPPDDPPAMPAPPPPIPDGPPGNDAPPGGVIPPPGGEAALRP